MKDHIKMSCMCEWPGPVRAVAATALGAESFMVFFSQIIFKAFKDTHFHYTRIKNASLLLSQSEGRPVEANQSKGKMAKWQIIIYVTWRGTSL